MVDRGTGERKIWNYFKTTELSSANAESTGLPCGEYGMRQSRW